MNTKKTWAVRIASALLVGMVGFFMYRLYATVTQLRATVCEVQARCLSSSDVKEACLEPKIVMTQDGGSPRACSWRDVQERLNDSVVQIFSSVVQYNWREPYKISKHGLATGTGFFIDKNGSILTNAHVIDQSVRLEVQVPSCGKKRFEVEIVGLSVERDLALLRLTPDAKEKALRAGLTLNPLSFGDSDKVHRADEIMAIGYPLGQEGLKSTTGIVSGRECMDGGYRIQVSAAINPGNSGGPSINKQGEVIGINSSKIVAVETESVGYIIPINEAKLFLKQLEEAPVNKDSKVKFLRKPYLGVLFIGSTPEMAKVLGNPVPSGVYVVESYKGSPMQKAGISSGDMIYKIDGFDIDEHGEIKVPWSEDRVSVSAYVSRLHLGQHVHLTVYRNGKERTVMIKFAESEQMPIRYMFPPYEKCDYEVFAGMVVMPLEINHLPLLMSEAPTLARYAETKYQFDPQLVITQMFSDSLVWRSQSLRPGTLIKEVNGEKVSTVEEYRKALLKNKETGYITFKSTDNIFCVLDLKDVLEEEDHLANTYFYPKSKLVDELSGEKK